MPQHPSLRAILALAAGLLLAAAAHAQAFRTYLSSTGNDANPCTLTAPCRLLPAALAAVASGGEVWMLDSANYNTSTVNIGKSVTILAVPGAAGSVVAIEDDAIFINTPGVQVKLRNLLIGRFALAAVCSRCRPPSGIRMFSDGALTIENSLIANMPLQGIWLQDGGSLRLTDTTVRDNGDTGLWLRGGSRTTITRSVITGNPGGVIVDPSSTADIADSTINSNGFGVQVNGSSFGTPTRVSISDSQVVGNTNVGISADSNSGAQNASVSVSNSLVSNNAKGIVATGSGSKVWVSGNTVTDNLVNLENAGGVFESAGDNMVRINVPANGTITPVSKR